MRNFRKVLIGMMVFLPGVCHGQAKCSWIDAAAARGILGGDVTEKVDISDTSFEVCEFSTQKEQVRHRLSVVVVVMTDTPKQFSTYVRQCGPDAKPLRTIGDQAVMCSMQTHVNLYGGRVIGRVRDRAFHVTVASSIQDDPFLTPETRRESALLAAEQVAQACKAVGQYSAPKNMTD